MPVPVAVTHGGGGPAGLAHHTNMVVETEGPFARLAAQKAAGTAVEAAPAAAAAQPSAIKSDKVEGIEYAVEVNDLSFRYPDISGQPIMHVRPVIENMNVKLSPGSCCLLIGANGAGKTTLLKVLGGKHMVDESCVRILGQSAFHTTSLESSGALSYIGGNWERDVAFAGYSVALTGDFPASHMLDSIHGVDPARKQRLIDVLDINVNWRMHTVSDGQRRRVQLAMGLLKPFKVLLLDEITVDLDVLGRSELMNFLKSECTERGATIIYATHIFDGLESWPTHLLYFAKSKVVHFDTADKFPQLAEGNLLGLVEGWLRGDYEETKKLRREREARIARGEEEPVQKKAVYATNNGYGAGRLNSTLAGADNSMTSLFGMKNSSNHVMRN